MERRLRQHYGIACEGIATHRIGWYLADIVKRLVDTAVVNMAIPEPVRTPSLCGDVYGLCVGTYAPRICRIRPGSGGLRRVRSPRGGDYRQKFRTKARLNQKELRYSQAQDQIVSLIPLRMPLVEHTARDFPQHPSCPEAETTTSASYRSPPQLYQLMAV